MALRLDTHNNYSTKKLLVRGVTELALISTAGLQLEIALAQQQPVDGLPLSWLAVVLIVAVIGKQMLEVVCCIALCCIRDVPRANDHRRAAMFADFSVAAAVVVLSLFVIVHTLSMPLNPWVQDRS